MFGLAAIKVYIAVERVEIREGFDGLYAPAGTRAAAVPGTAVLPNIWSASKKSCRAGNSATGPARCCEEGAATMAPLAPRVLEKALTVIGRVMERVTARYLDHMPLYD